MENTGFQEWVKIPRLKRGCTITEKIDGTSSQIHITDEGEFLAGSRTRYITTKDDNYGFAKWAEANKEELMKLGPGRHFGEWWGSGCQRGYGLEKGEKRFSLFNVGRWREAVPHPPLCQCGTCPVQGAVLPACVSLVPVLYEGPFSSNIVDQCLEDLRVNGSKASPGFMKPEGIIIYHAAARSMFKVTLEKDEEPKSRTANGKDAAQPVTPVVYEYPDMPSDLRSELMIEAMRAAKACKPPREPTTSPQPGTANEADGAQSGTPEAAHE